MGMQKNPENQATRGDQRAGLVAGGLILIALGSVLWLALRDDPDTVSGGERPDDAATAGAPTLEGQGPSESTPPDPVTVALPEQTEGHVLVVGRVVDPDFVARANRAVRMRTSDRPEQTTQTDANGGFAFTIGSAPTSEIHVTLVAVSPEGSVGEASVRINPLGPRVLDIGTITLRSGLDLSVRVVRDSRPVSGAQVFATSVPIAQATRTQRWIPKPWSGWGYTAVSDESGVAVLRNVAGGAVRILAIADGPVRGEVNVRTDQLEAPIVVELQSARDLRVEVVRASDGSPVPGCHIGAVGTQRPLEEPWARPVTDENGVATLRNAPRERIELLIAGPDWASAYLKMPRFVPPDVTTFRMEVPAPIRIVVPIEVSDGPMPEDGTRVRLEQHSWAWWPGTRTYLAREGVVRDGSLVIERYYPHGWVRALARLPDGRAGHIFFKIPDGPDAERTTTTPVVFHRSRAVDVHLVERGTGRPAVGVAVTLSIPQHGSHHLGPVRTDATGHARIEGAPAAKGVINLCSNPEWVETSRQHVFAPGAPVDLTEADAVLELQVEAVIDAVVRVRTDGESLFPPGMEVQLFYWPQGVDGARPPGLRLIPDRGELWFRVRRPITEPQSPLRLLARPQRVHLLITSTAHVTQKVTLAYDPESNRLVGDVNLAAGGRLITRVEAPSEGSFAFQLERHEGGKGWTRVATPPLVRFAGEDDRKRYEGLPPGRYRLTETFGNKSSDEVQVRGGPEPTVLTWTFGPVEYAEGTVVLPAGIDPKGLQVYAWSDTNQHQPAGNATMNGTHFKLRIPGSGRFRLYPIHPKCRTADEEGQVVISGPEKGLRLRMVLR